MADMSKYVQKYKDGLIVIYLINKEPLESIKGNYVYHSLVLCMLGKISADDIRIYLSYFS